MEKYFLAIKTFLSKEQQNVAAYGLIFLLGFSAFSSALSFVPADGDDLVLLSSVAKTSTPFTYFLRDWGLGNNAYRPLHSLTLWFAYQFFGVSAGYNQLFNLILHLVIICLLFRLIRSVQQDIILSFLLTSLSLFSINTISPVTWVSDRPSLFVALFFLLLLSHLYKNGQPQQANILYIAVLSIFALISKESGLILPLFVLYYAVGSKQAPNDRNKLIILASIIIALYIALRFAIFGSNANSYAESGYIFGTMHYGSSDALPNYLQYYAYFENILKNAIAPFCPIFNNEGGLSLSSLIDKGPFWLLTPLLFILTTRKELSTFQKMALVIILLNSVIHYSVFRYRTQYLSQLAVSMFIISSPLMNSKVNIKTIVKVVTAVLLIFSVIWVNRSVNDTLFSRYEMLNKYDLSPIVQEFSPRIDGQIVSQVLEKYKR